MILVLASEFDDDAQLVVAAWPRQQARLVTPRDLCARGWRIEFGRSAEFRFVAGGVVFSMRDVSGVLTLLPYVFPHELLEVENTDRPYVAAEVNAFLVYALTAVQCPVMNRPTPQNLSGPSWRREQWIHAGRALNIPTSDVSRSGQVQNDFPVADGTQHRVSVVDGRCVGDDRVSHGAQLIELARIAQVSFLEATFVDRGAGPSLDSVQLRPDLSDGRVLAAIHQFFGHARDL